MPKKDTNAAVIGMLSTAGAQTRRIPETAEPAGETVVPPSVTVTEEAPASVSALPTPTRPTTATASAPPRTLRLRSATAERLRRAWIEAKRDDVFLTAQDFASDLLDEAMARRRRRPAVQN